MLMRAMPRSQRDFTEIVSDIGLARIARVHGYDSDDNEIQRTKIIQNSYNCMISFVISRRAVSNYLAYGGCDIRCHELPVLKLLNS
jgi:hypothetical protein